MAATCSTAVCADGSPRRTSRGRSVRRSLTAVGLVVGLGISSSVHARAQALTPPPEFTGARVHLKDVPNVSGYSGLDAQIRRLEQTSAQTYYVVVIGSSGHQGPFSTRDYGDRLYEAWREQAAQKGLALDPERSVLIVVALADRQISVHPGALLQDRYGLRGDRIDREIVQPSFVPRARAGNYPEAISALLDALEGWITNKDDEQKRQRAEAERRAVQLRQDADEALAGCRRLRDEARKELAEKQAAGLEVGTAGAAIEAADKALDRLSGRASAEPDAVLWESPAIQKSFQGAIDGLRQLVAEQSDAARKIDGLADQARKVRGSLESARKAGLPVAPASKEFEATLGSLDSAREVIRSNPRRALALENDVDQRLSSLRLGLERLPGRTRRQQDLAAQLAADQKEVETELDRARRSGVNIGEARADFEQTRAAIAGGIPPGGVDDLEASISGLEGAQRRLRGIVSRLRSEEDRHRFNTRTLPLAVIAAIAAIALLVLGVLRLLHLRARSAVGQRLKTCRERAVQVMEQLDALKERHKLLPVADADFTQPMAGETLGLYNHVQADLNRLWERWLAMMEVVDNAQELVRTQGLLGVAHLKKAATLLGHEGEFDELRQPIEACGAALDRLNRAHEESQASFKAVTDQRESVTPLLDTLASLALNTAPYQPEIEAVDALIGQAGSSLTPDPLGARGLLEQAGGKVTSLLERARAVTARLQEAQQVQETLDGMEQEVAKHRAAGLRLDEEGANPDPIVAQARGKLDEARAALQAGDPGAAASALETARGFATQGREAIGRTLAARDACRHELPARKEDARRLAAMEAEARTHRAELERQFAAGSWKNVAPNLERARTLSETVERGLLETEDETAEGVQHYSRALKQLETIANQQKEVEQLLESVGAQRHALVALREECRKLQSDLAEALEAAAQFVKDHDDSVGEPARSALATAGTVLRQAAEAMDAPRPDWPALRPQLARAEQELALAKERAEADAANHRQCLAQIETVRDLGRRVAALLQGEQKDRPAANARYRTADESLEQVAREARAPRSDWDRLLRQLQDVAADFTRAEEMAQADVRLANQGIAAMAAANRSLRTARAFSSLGVSAQIGSAEVLLQQAQAAYGIQEYERVIEQAQAAEQAARSALDDARREAERRQRRIDEERRRQTAQAAAQAAWVLGTNSSAAPSFSAQPTFSPPSSVPSPSSAGSWSSGSSQSSW